MSKSEVAIGATAAKAINHAGAMDRDGLAFRFENVSNMSTRLVPLARAVCDLFELIEDLAAQPLAKQQPENLRSFALAGRSVASELNDLAIDVVEEVWALPIYEGRERNPSA